MIPCTTKLWRPSAGAERLFAQQKPAQDIATRKHYGRDATPYEVCLKLFGALPLKHPQKHEFLLLCYQQQWPEKMQIERDGVLNHWGIRMARGFCWEKRINLMGCGSSWKTGNASAYIYTAWKAKPFNTSAFLSTTSQEAGQSRTWGSIKDWHKEDTLSVGKRIESLHMITLDEEVKDEDGNKMRDFRDSIKCVNIKPGSEGNNVMAAIVGRKNDNVIWCAQPLDAEVLTPSGWTCIGHLVEGEVITSPSGGKQHVTKLHPIEKKQVFELLFTDGSRARSTEDHIWRLTDSMNAQPVVEAPLKYFMGRLKHKQTPRWALPSPVTVEFEKSTEKLPLHPYLVGALIGDGGITYTTTFYNFDADIVEEVRGCLPVGHKMTTVRPGQHQISGNQKNLKGANLVKEGLEKLGLLGRGSSDKFIPNNYLFASVEERVHLLQGLLDTDGCVLHSTIRYTSISPQLRKDVMHLVRSLGGYARESLPFTVVISLPQYQTFRCKRKIDRIRPSNYKQRRKAIVSITPVGEQNVRCISVSSESGLYFTNDFVLTHNCDEFPFMDVGVINARVNLNTNPFYQFIGLGNAPQEGDPMYIDCTPFGPKYPDGWRSVDKDTDESWPTERGLCLYFNGAKSPNFTCGRPKPPFPKMMNEEMRREIEKDAGGDETPMYYKQFYGFPPTVDISDKLLSIKLMATNRAFLPVVWEGGLQTVLGGFDPGFRKDGDPCVAQFGKLGMGRAEVDGEENAGFRKVLAMEKEGISLVPRQGSSDSFETQIARLFVDECVRRGCSEVAMDVTGDGGIMLQHIERDARARGYKLNVLAVSFSGLAEDKIVIPGERRTAREMFANMVAQLWGTFRLSVLNKVILGMFERSQCTTQLCARKMGSDEKKRMTIERKVDMKKRIRRSPDQADAAVVLCHLALRHGLAGYVAPSLTPPPPFNPQEYLGKGVGGGGKYQTPARSVYGGR